MPRRVASRCRLGRGERGERGGERGADGVPAMVAVVLWAAAAVLAAAPASSTHAEAGEGLRGGAKQARPRRRACRCRCSACCTKSKTRRGADGGWCPVVFVGIGIEARRMGRGVAGGSIDGGAVRCGGSATTDMLVPSAQRNVVTSGMPLPAAVERTLCIVVAEWCKNW